MRVAAIDIGTNTTLLLIAERRPGGELVAVEERATITRLGQGVDKTRRLAPEAIERTNACLDDYAALVQLSNVSRIAVVGTSAMRDAGGGDEVRDHVKARFGVEARTISGDEEARLTFGGALSGLPGVDGPVVVFDIGGGSTEVVRGDRSSGAIDYAHSFDVGSVRLTERHVRSDPPAPGEIAALHQAARDAFDSLPSLTTTSPPVGIAGTVTTLAAVALAMETYDGSRVHGSRLERQTIAQVLTELEAMPLEVRRKRAGLEPKRADVILAGAAVALAFLDRVGASSMIVSDRGVRWGLAERLARAT